MSFITEIEARSLYEEEAAEAQANGLPVRSFEDWMVLQIRKAQFYAELVGLVQE